MSLRLSLKLKNELVSQMCVTLEECLLANESIDYSSIQSLWYGLETFQKNKEAYEQIDKFGDGSTFINFFLDSLDRRLRNLKGQGVDLRDGALTELHHFANVKVLAETLLSEFISLPWKYEIFINLPSTVAKCFYDTSRDGVIGDSIAIISENSMTVKPDDSLFVEKPRWYLQVKTEGYVNSLLQGRTLSGAISLFKSFLGLSLVMELVETQRAFMSHLPETSVIVCQEDNGELKKVKETKLPISTRLFTLKHQKNAAERPYLISYPFQEQNKENKQLLLAAEWFFEGCTGNEDLWSYVRLMVTMEILLDSDQGRVVESLSDRFAYLVGHRQERRALIKKFKDAYGVRSSIVHGGRNYLTYEQRDFLYELEEWCRRIFHRELRTIL